jgi:hypothetical protein
VACSREKMDDNFASFHETQRIESEMKLSEINENKQIYAGFLKTKQILFLANLSESKEI